MNKINPKNYILTFKAGGISVFVADIHKDVYKELEVLYLIHKSEFKQYFTKKAFDRALNIGVNFYKNSKEVRDYKKDLSSFIGEFRKFFKSDIQKSGYISEQTLKKFFAYTIKLCKDYTKMNIEFTDKAFLLKDKNKTIAGNLKFLAPFKDVVRGYMNEVLFEDKGYSQNIFKILSKQFKLPLKNLNEMTQLELLDLYHKKLITKVNTEIRQDAFVLIWNKKLPLEKKLAKSVIKSFEEKIEAKSEVKGQVANKGNVTGRVKIIPVDYNNLAKTNKEIMAMKKGAILVAETTAPELIIACQKAAAIITDLGGLMSHAAIVSRELNIPCIVGTKNATKIFKNGDLVKVDANKGIIKKI